MQKVERTHSRPNINMSIIKSEKPNFNNLKHRKVFRSKTQEEMRPTRTTISNDSSDLQFSSNNKRNVYKNQRPKSFDINQSKKTRVLLERRSTGSNFTFFKIRSRSDSNNPDPEKVSDSNIRKRLSGHFKDSFEAVFTKLSDKHFKYLSKFSTLNLVSQ